MATTHAPAKHETHDAPVKHDLPVTKDVDPADALLLNPDRSDVGEVHLTVRDEQVKRSEEALAGLIAQGAAHARDHDPALRDAHDKKK